MNIQELSAKLLALKKEVKELDEKQKAEMAPKVVALSELQTKFMEELGKLGLKSIKTEEANFSIATRKGFNFINEIEAMKWAIKNRIVSIDKKMAAQKLNELKKLPEFVTRVEQNYLTIKEDTKK
jgi:predicted transcriptional regulator